MSGRLILWSVTSALAGFLFGFDTVVISGAEKAIEDLWDLSKFWHGWVISAALWGTVLGAITGGWPTDRWGRKTTLLLIGALYLISAIWSALATGPYTFAIARFIGGVGVGVSTVAAPLYIAEIAPASSRGRLAGMFQFNIVLGILVAYLSNAMLADVGEHAWRWMLAVEAIPAAIYAVMTFGLPESPRWLIAKRGDQVEGVRVLRLIRPTASEEQIDAEAAEIVRMAPAGRSSTAFFTARLRKPIMLAFLVAAFNQLSGVNIILYFAPRILESAGFETQAALVKSIGIGITNLVFTMLGLMLIDFFGRKTLLILGSIGYIGSLGVCAWAFQTENFEWVPMCIYIFIAAHAIGQGAVIWVLISEMFPTEHRAAGQALGSSTHWIFAAVLTTLFPLVADAVQPTMLFAFFCGMMCLHLVWVLTMVPETKGASLEELERQLGVAPE